MKVPLDAHRVIKGDKQYIEIWSNGVRHLVKSPFSPYMYSDVDITFPESKKTKLIRTHKTDLEKRPVFKHEFKTVKQVSKYRNANTFEDNIPFIERVRTDMPDFYLRYPHTKPLTYLNIDIEQAWDKEKKYLPDETDTICNIGYQINNGKIKSLRCGWEDYNVISTFFNILRKQKEKQPTFPDVIYGYNVEGYDLRVLLNKAKRYDIDTSFLSKTEESPYVQFSFGKWSVHIPGSVIYNLDESARNDPSLSGEVPDRRLKSVAKYFGIPIIDLPYEKIPEMINTKELAKYNMYDVNANFELFKRYSPRIWALAEELLHYPLGPCLSYSVSLLTTLIQGTEYVKHNMVSDGTNHSIYPDIFSRKPNFQGALVGIKSPGLYSPVRKLDFSSMYPTIARVYNLSPDTTTLLRFEEYNKDGFGYEDKGDYYILRIPDRNVLPGGRLIVIKVLKKKGFMTDLISQFQEARNVHKRELKKLEQKEQSGLSLSQSELDRKKTLFSTTDALKVVLNGAFYGGLANASHPYGKFCIPAAITGIARQLTSILIRYLDNTPGVKVIEWDTDGIYVEYNDVVDFDSIMENYYKLLEERFPFMTGNMKLDDDFYQSGYFYKAKNYMLLTKSNTVIKHGAAFKSRSFAPLANKFINECAPYILQGDTKNTKKTLEKYQAIKNFPLKDFVMSTRLQTSFDSISRSSTSYQLARQAMEQLRIVPEVGNTYYYVKTKRGFKLYQSVQKADVDYDYYLQQIRKIASRLVNQEVVSLERCL